jgi:hypothetical protein
MILSIIDFGISADGAVAFLVEALEDPLNPRWCGQCTMAGILVIKLDHNSAESVINKNHLFGSTIVSFLTAKRSSAEIETLESSWSQCNCSVADVIGHRGALALHRIIDVVQPTVARGQHNKLEVVGTVVEKLLEFFEDATSNAKPFSIAVCRHPRIWPAKPTDLIPYGAQHEYWMLFTILLNR